MSGCARRGGVPVPPPRSARRRRRRTASARRWRWPGTRSPRARCPGTLRRRGLRRRGPTAARPSAALAAVAGARAGVVGAVAQVPLLAARHLVEEAVVVGVHLVAEHGQPVPGGVGEVVAGLAHPASVVVLGV